MFVFYATYWCSVNCVCLFFFPPTFDAVVAPWA